ncbi:putative WD40-repeat-containing domain protein [Seiridium cardinale]
MSLLNTEGDAVALRRGTPPSSPMRRDFVLNPITALAFYTSPKTGRLYLLAGEDNHINLYDVGASEQCGEIGVFLAQSVHGIAVGSDDGVNQRILVWGGFSVAVLPIEAVEAVICGNLGACAASGPMPTARASDWILEGVLSPHGNNELALLTAHNELIMARYSEEHGSIEFLDMCSPSRPILYSGNFSWETSDCVLVAAGTVFGEIVVWKYHAAPQEHQSQCEVLFVFSGHEGSIFGVHISPIIDLETGERLRLLASCSDDRTIRIWDITDPQDLSSSTHDEYQKKILAVRQTGFGDSIETTSEEETSARCLAVAMGHISRIWQVEFSQQQSIDNISSSIELWSFGEDATAQKWSLSLGTPKLREETAVAIRGADLPTRTGGRLISEAIFANHDGKNIWSHAMTVGKHGQSFVVTGASDGKISIIGDDKRVFTAKTLDAVPPAPETTATDSDDIIKASDTTAAHSRGSRLVTSEEVAGVTNNENEGTRAPPKKRKVKKPAKDFFNRYAILSDGSILTSTKNGRFFVGDAVSQLSWKELLLPDAFRGAASTYAVVRGSTNASAAFVGTAEGNIFVYQSADSSNLHHLTKVHGKVSDMFSMSPGTHSSHELQASEVATESDYSVGRHRTKLLITVLGSETASLLDFEVFGSPQGMKKVDVPVDSRFVVTSAAIRGTWMILGSRTGYISILEASSVGSYRPRSTVEPKSNDCVTSITFLPTGADEKTLFFLTTSRDGKFRIYSIDHNDDNVVVTSIHETSPPFGPIVEGAWFSRNREGSTDLILYGFRSTKFVVWNETQRREIATIECGGGHRTFAYDPLPDSSDAFRLVWTQASQLCFFSQNHACHRALKSGGHGREIKTISSSGELVATAAEDTTIRIWSYESRCSDKRKALQCLAVLENHTTGIQSLKWYRQSHLFSSAGNKEFFVWRIGRLESEYQGLAVKCEAAYPDRTNDVDLRIMNFDVDCADDSSNEDAFFYVTMALSNSTLLTYTYSEAAGFKLVAQGAYTGACMTQIRHLHTDGTHIQILTAATDGRMAIWEAKMSSLDDTQVCDYTSLAVTKLHQSTMKSLDIRTVSSKIGTSYLVVTGGDDNAFGVTHILRSSTSGSIAVKSKSIVRSAHAAALTGIAILSLNLDGEDAVVVSCSNDQRVKRWHVMNWQSNEIKVELLDNRYSSVADAGDLEVLEDATRFVVGGVGLEIWDVEDEGSDGKPGGYLQSTM